VCNENARLMIYCRNMIIRLQGAISSLMPKIFSRSTSRIIESKVLAKEICEFTAEYQRGLLQTSRR
jgi:hypothetical protein